RQAGSILGYPPEEFLAPDFWGKHVRPEDRERVLDTLREALRRSDDRRVDHGMVAADGRVLWLHTCVSGERSLDEAPQLHGMSIDVTPMKRFGDFQALLADTGAMLSESLDVRANLPKVARRTVPFPAAWCVVDELVDQGAVRPLALAHA